MTIALVDYGMGNRRSVEKALEHVGANVARTADRDEIAAADAIVLPGVGAFPEAMRRLAALGLIELLRERAQAGVPLLGICLGMQLLFDRSDEHEGAAGLGLLPGAVTRLDAPGLKIPLIGWNTVTFSRASTLTDGLGAAVAFYHVHTFACRPVDERDVVGRGEYGERFVSIVERGNVMGVQFHPEKSSLDGLALLRNFAGVACSRMIVYPAIDIRGGKAVRLTHGRFDAETVYHDDPLEAAQSWVEAGARFLHVIDLDGAKAGAPVSIDHLRRIVAGTGVPVQYGGGLRTVEAVREALRAGAERVLVGTAALRDVDFLDEIVAAYGPRVVVSVDVRGGKIATSGWTEVTDLPAADAIGRLHDRGVASFVYTDADRDGALEGPSLDDVSTVAAAVRGHFLYAGGIGALDHLRALRGLRQVNLSGVIVGKALYERRFTIAEAQAALDGKD